MTARARAAQQAANELRFFSVGDCRDCATCNPEHEHGDAVEVAPEFSWSPCELCRSRLGGDRYPAHYIDDDGEIAHLTVCADCLLDFA